MAVDQAAKDGVLLLGNGAEPKGLDPQLVTGVTEHNILASLLEGLVNEDPKDLHPVPGVAESWDLSDDGRTYTFHLRADAKWSNGEPVTASDFVFSYQRILSPGLAAEYAYMLYPLVNAKAFNEGKVTDFAQVGAKAIDDRTLVLKLTDPVPYFLQLLNHYSWWPVHPATILKFGKIDDPQTPWTRPENFVGNGPFVLKSWQPNQKIVVERSPTYWDAKKVKLNGIEFLAIDSAETEERAFRNGQVHITSTVPPHRVPVYQEKEPDLIRIDPYLGTYFYRFNCTHKPLDDPRVRRALAMTINRAQICRAILKSGQKPALCLTPPGTNGYVCESHLTEDAEQSKTLLAEAGYPNGAGFPELRLLYNTSETHKDIAEAIQQMWKSTLGIQISLENQEWKVYLDSMKRMDYDVARASWIGDYNDPNTFLDMWITDGGNNRTGWSNADYDRFIAQAAAERDPPKRLGVFQQAEALLVDDMPIAPIYFYVHTMLIRPSVKGWNPTILDHHPYKYVSLVSPQRPAK
jgi:oligopeptide transport system substrate-binding protein